MRGADVNIDDSGEFGQRIVALAEVFDVKLSPQRAALYFEALRDLPFPAVVQALTLAVQSCKFFPRPAELRTFVLGDAEDVTEAAWIAFRRAMPAAGYMASVVVDDAALGDTIVAMFGSWPAACHSDLTPEMWAAKRKEFSRVYRVFKHRGLEGGRYLIGVAETHNSAQPDWMRYVPGARITRAGTVERLNASALEAARVQLAAESNGFTRMDAERVVKALPPTLRQEA